MSSNMEFVRAIAAVPFWLVGGVLGWIGRRIVLLGNSIGGDI